MWLNKITGKFLLTIILLMTSVAANAQNDSLRSYNKGKRQLFFHTSVEINARGLTNEFLGKFYKGDFLSNDLLTKVSARLSDKNLLGYRLDGGLYYIFVPENYKKYFGYYFGIEEHSFAELSFRKNLFDLGFFGNGSYVDQFVNLDNEKLDIMSWQQFKAGIYKTYYGPRSFNQVGGAVSFVKGQKNISVDVHKASFFTQKDAEFVALSVDMDLSHTDSSNSGLGAFNGYGASLEFMYDYSDLKNNEFHLRVSNIGYIHWDATPDHFNRDTTFKFDGFNVDLFHLNNSIITAKTPDSILHVITGGNVKNAYATMLPLDIDIIYTHHFWEKRFSLTAEIKHRFFSLYRPCFVLKPGYTWFIGTKDNGSAINSKSYSISFYPVISYGGYGGFNAGLDIAANIRQKLMIELGTNTINSLISPKNSAGLAGNITLYKMF